MEWFRMYSEARNDAKLRALTDSQFRVWFNMLCFANEQENRGVISGYDIELLAVEVANNNVDLLKDTIAMLVKLRIIEVSETEIVFINFRKRNYDKPSDHPEEVRKRVSKHRRQKRNNVTPITSAVTPCNADVTPCNALYSEEEEEDTNTNTHTNIKTIEVNSDEEEERGVQGGEDSITEAASSSSPTSSNSIQIHECLKILKKITGYPFDLEKDKELLQSLEKDFPSIDMLNELKKFAAYKLDHPLRKGSNARLQIRRWFENEVKWRKEEQYAKCEGDIKQTDCKPGKYANLIPIYRDG